jgi:hypothetical protein
MQSINLMGFIQERIYGKRTATKPKKLLPNEPQSHKNGKCDFYFNVPGNF